MSKEHLKSIQQMIEELERFGWTDITEQAKPYSDPYLSLCTLARPASEGSVSIDTVDELLTLLEQADPSRLKQQVWFCEACHMVSAIRYRKGADFREVMLALAAKHRELSANCPNDGLDLRVISAAAILLICRHFSEAYCADPCKWKMSLAEAAKLPSGIPAC